MKIALAVPQFFPDVYGGVESYTLALAKEYRQRGHSVLVLCTRRDASAQSVSVERDLYVDIPVWRIRYDPERRPARTRQILFDPLLADHAGQVLQDWGADLIHLMNVGGFSAAVIPVAKALGVPVVWTATDFGMTCARYDLVKWDGSICPGKADFHACLDCLRPRTGKSSELYDSLSSWSESSFTSLARLINRFPLKKFGLFETALVVEQRLDVLLPLLNQIDRIIAPCSWMKEVLVMNGAEAERIVVSVYGIEHNGVNARLRKPHRPLRFVFLGRIHSMKGVHILVDAFNGIQNNDGATLTIFGSPSPDQYSYAGRLWSMAKDNPHIQFGKQINRDQVDGVFEDFDVMLVPSMWYENSPLVVLESLSQKMPVIASDVAGIRDLIQHDENGLLFRTGDAGDLRSQLQKLIAHPEKVTELASRIQPVKSIQEDADLLIRLYEELLQ